MLPKRPSREEVQVRAYFLWERAGRPEGQDWGHWFTAEDELYFEYHRVRRFPARRDEGWR